MSPAFDYTSGNPNNLVGGASASMADIQGPFTDLKTFLNNRIAAVPTLVSSLPVSPVDGQEIYFQADGTNGIIWHLRYRAASASAYKWEFVGGADLATPVLGAIVVGTSTVALSGQTITAPLAGEYRLEFGAMLLQPNNSSMIQVIPYVGGVASSSSARLSTVNATGMTDYTAVMSVANTLVLTATQVVDLRAISTGAGANAYQPWMRLRPVRVG